MFAYVNFSNARLPSGVATGQVPFGTQLMMQDADKYELNVIYVLLYFTKYYVSYL